MLGSYLTYACFDNPFTCLAAGASLLLTVSTSCSPNVFVKVYSKHLVSGSRDLVICMWAPLFPTSLRSLNPPRPPHVRYAGRFRSGLKTGPIGVEVCVTHNPTHHGGYTWMMSLGVGISWAAVSLLKSTRRRRAAAMVAWGGRGWQRASCMLHSSWTSRTSSTSTPGLTAAQHRHTDTRGREQAYRFLKSLQMDAP